MSQGYLYDTGDDLIIRKASVSGSAAHLSSEAVRITIDGDQYSAYPLDKTYKDLLEYPSPLYMEDDTGITTDINVLFPTKFKDDASAFDGYSYEVTFTGSSTIYMYAESETGTLYYIPQE